MRRALLVLLLLAPVAAAHGGHEAEHVNPARIDLAPGASNTTELTFTEGMGNGSFEAGWVFVLNAILIPGSAPATVELHVGHEVALGRAVATFTVQAGPTQRFTAAMPETGVYSIVVRNPSVAQNTSLLYFFDQSCNCAGKPIPVELPAGLVLFNVDVPRPSTWKATFPEPPVHRLSVVLATRENPNSSWPQDFRVLQRSDQAVLRDVGAGPARLHELTWTADQPGRYYFFVQSAGIDLSKFDRADPVGSVMITPLYEQLKDTPKATPLGLAALVVALGVGALARRR